MFTKRKTIQSKKFPLSFFNTLSGKIELFSALKPPAVTMYSCGPTVYDHVHIGNLRSYVFSDILKRTLTINGYGVEHTINLTDFGHLTSDGDEGEDKMMLALKRAGIPISMEAMAEIAETYTTSFKADMDALNNIPPTTYASASAYIEKEIALVQTLVEKGYTYETSDGVYFDISRFPTYGRLGNIDIEKLKSGARVEVNPEKHHPADFAVWKKGGLGWESPWGKGFPGWHIECTAMVFATLGKQIDIHTGGIDHIATHHNGEIAQAEAATGKSPYVRYWLHHAFITIENSKISKSLGNTIHLSQLRERGYSPLDLRYWFMSGHYRTTMNFTFDALDGAKTALFRLKRHLFEEYRAIPGGAISEQYAQEFWNAIALDLNTPKALAVVWKLIDDTTVAPCDKVATIISFDALLGLGFSDSREHAVWSLRVLSAEELPASVRKLLAEREEARKNKNWELADSLRQHINLEGYVVEDTPQGARITRA